MKKKLNDPFIREMEKKKSKDYEPKWMAYNPSTVSEFGKFKRFTKKKR